MPISLYEQALTMPGLSIELYNRCRPALLKCSEFDSDASLQAVFVIKELSPFGGGLPEAASRSGRVDACLAFLADKHLSDGRPVLPLFLAVLSARYQEGDALRDEIRALTEQVHSRLVSPDQHNGSNASSPASASAHARIRDINVATSGGTIITGAQQVIVERSHRCDRSDPDNKTE